MEHRTEIIDVLVRCDDGCGELAVWRGGNVPDEAAIAHTREYGHYTFVRVVTETVFSPRGTPNVEEA